MNLSNLIALTFLSQQSVLFTSFGTKNKAANFSADFRLINNEKDLKEVLLDKNRLYESIQVNSIAIPE